MAPSNNNKKTITDLHKLITEGIKKQEILEEGIKQISTKLDNLLEYQKKNINNTEEIQHINQKLHDIITSQTNNTKNTAEIIQERKEQNDEIAASLVKYFEDNYGHLKEIGDMQIKEQSYLAKKEHIQQWRALLNDRKMNFYNAIKSAETASIYRNFLKMEEAYIPKKFREKTTPHDTEAQIRIKTHLSIQKVTANIHILEDKVIHYTDRYLHIDKHIEEEIHKTCPQITHPFLLNLWRSDCEKEETTSKNILEKKTRWMIDLPNREKEMEREKEKEKENDRQKPKYDNRPQHPNRTHSITNDRTTQNHQQNGPASGINWYNGQYNRRKEQHNQNVNNSSPHVHQYNGRHTHTNNEQQHWSNNSITHTDNNDTHQDSHRRPNSNREINTGDHNINRNYHNNYNNHSRNCNDTHQENCPRPNSNREINTRDHNINRNYYNNYNNHNRNNNDSHQENCPRPNTNRESYTGNHNNRNYSNNHYRNNNNLGNGYQNPNRTPRHNNIIGYQKSTPLFLGNYHQGRNQT
jgi:hypothetical protein